MHLPTFLAFIFASLALASPANLALRQYPRQEGIASNCPAYYKAVRGDFCVTVATLYNLTLADFFAWNPAVGANCESLWEGHYYCVAKPVAPAATATATTGVVAVPTATATVTASVTGCVAAPTPTQPGSVCECKIWHRVREGEVCWMLLERYGISQERFLELNPGVGGSACNNIWLEFYVCVGA
ncbi:hypothetical protein QBC34DRAFT_471184 [Podospora aff. communis PSN243]|uniref:LysM domain-containing protein n=1 Tax=Podospora aff. communis PSN243 TaxID=3040156 RepID=A0AAV9H0Y0_9PEZI|nr:hypothetical protein QBC34DRAFT_471184 [Podospora aff. communis PSN243]